MEAGYNAKAFQPKVLRRSVKVMGIMMRGYRNVKRMSVNQTVRIVHEWVFESLEGAPKRHHIP